MIYDTGGGHKRRIVEIPPDIFPKYLPIYFDADISPYFFIFVF